MVDTIKAYFFHVTFEQISREKNRAADAMATLASLLQLPDEHEWYEFLVEEVVQPTFTQLESHIIFLLDTPHSPWYDSYLCDNIMPSNLSQNQKWNLSDKPRIIH